MDISTRCLHSCKRFWLGTTKYVERITRAAAWLQNSPHAMARLLTAINHCSKREMMKIRSVIATTRPSWQLQLKLHRSGGTFNTKLTSPCPACTGRGLGPVSATWLKHCSYNQCSWEKHRVTAGIWCVLNSTAPLFKSVLGWPFIRHMAEPLSRVQPPLVGECNITRVAAAQITVGTNLLFPELTRVWEVIAAPRIQGRPQNRWGAM